jgi:1-acyl-sn-glycerol-3-phosphate acyltransferase
MTVDASPPAPPPGPKYLVPWPRLAVMSACMAFGIRRSFTQDGIAFMRTNRSRPRRIEGIEHVPREGPFIIVMNHLSRRGLRPFHCAMAIAEAIEAVRPGAAEIHWAFTSEYVDLRIGPLTVPVWLLRWIFGRVARMYGLVTIARREELVMGRATALRQMARIVTREPIGMTPEGLESNGILIRPQPGTGLFLASVEGHRAPLLPVGLFEDGDTLCVRFGPPFRINLPRGVDRAEQDRAASDLVMLAIGRQLPPSYWGAYADQLSEGSQA